MNGNGLFRAGRCRVSRPFRALISLLALSAPLFSQDIPPKPAGGEFTTDLAGLLDAGTKQKIAAFQRTAFEKHDVPIIVVTIYRMKDHDASAAELEGFAIEGFARKWFDRWEIGTLNRPEGGGANKGILLLVSHGDRRARIELGADWGLRWDAECQRIMNQAIIPRFKEGKFSTGIVDGVERLAAIAAIGPSGTPPSPGWMEQITENPSLRQATGASLFPPVTLGLLIGLGVLMIIASFFLPEYRKHLLIGGFGLIAVAVFTWIVIIILAFLMKDKKGKGSSSGGGGFSSSGGFSGGFSGGGGASGSW